MSTSSGPPFVAADWVEQRLDRVVLADVRWYLDGRSGYDAYVSGHIAGAIWVDLDRDLSADPGQLKGRHPLPSPELFAQRLGALGIGDRDTVVAYDDQGGGFAARLVWLLRLIGQRAALLDGGLGGWTGRLTTGDVSRSPAQREVHPWPAARISDADAVIAAVAAEGVVLDARAGARFRGEEGLPGERRLGHIPGARSAPWSESLGQDGRLRAPAELRARFEQLGVQESSDVIAYCGSGVTACHDLLAIEHAGLGRHSLYPGSFSAWASDPDRPIATGGQAGD